MLSNQVNNPASLNCVKFCFSGLLLVAFCIFIGVHVGRKSMLCEVGDERDSSAFKLEMISGAGLGLQVILGYNGREVRVSALLDSGARRTAVPRQLMEQLGGIGHPFFKDRFVTSGGKIVKHLVPVQVNLPGMEPVSLVASLHEGTELKFYLGRDLLEALGVRQDHLGRTGDCRSPLPYRAKPLSLEEEIERTNHKFRSTSNGRPVPHITLAGFVSIEDLPYLTGSADPMITEKHGRALYRYANYTEEQLASIKNHGELERLSRHVDFPWSDELDRG